MRQRLINEETINWNKVYINYTTEKVIIFKDKKLEKVRRVIPLQKFRKLLKRVPSINYLILLTL